MSAFIFAFEVHPVHIRVQNPVTVCLFSSCCCIACFSHCCIFIANHRRTHTPHECWFSRQHPVKPPFLCFLFYKYWKVSIWQTRYQVCTSLANKWSWETVRWDNAPYGEHVVDPWQIIVKHFGIVFLDVENALCLWHVEEFSPTGSIKALSRAGKLSQAWKSFSLSPVCSWDNVCQPAWFIAEFCCEIFCKEYWCSAFKFMCFVCRLYTCWGAYWGKKEVKR